MPFENESFDAVISLNVLHVVDDPIAMLNEIERVLAPDGIAFISDIRRSWLGLLMPILKTAYSPGEVAQLLQRSRLRHSTLHDQFPFALTIEV